MNMIVIKYMQIVCITLYFTSYANCNQLQLQNQNKHSDYLNLVASCVVKCLAIDGDTDGGSGSGGGDNTSDDSKVRIQTLESKKNDLKVETLKSNRSIRFGL